MKGVEMVHKNQSKLNHYEKWSRYNILYHNIYIVHCTYVGL